VGRLKTIKVADRLTQLGVKFDLLLTSPLLRAKETAAIFSSLADQIQETAHLAPEGRIEDWLQEFQPNGIKALALVGHQPNLGNWAEQLVWGSCQEKISLKKAGIIGVEVPTTDKSMGTGSLFLLVSPKWLLH
jgi:phosphohistidine phosphatase